MCKILEMTSRKKLGQKLKELRESRGLNQEQFASLVSTPEKQITQETVSKIENGIWDFSTKFIYLYLDKLGYDFSFIDLRS